jgi:branched-chain amino acid transport system substrate-binding protein
MITVKPVLLFAFLALLVAAGCSDADDGGESPAPTPAPTQAPVVLNLKLGVVQSQTGSAGIYGKTAANGIELAIKQFESETLRIESTLVDDLSTSEGGVAAVARLANEGANAIIGPTLSAVALEAYKVSQTRGVLSIGATTTGIGITDAGDQIYRTALPEASVVPPVLEYVNSKTPITRAVLFFDSSEAFSVGSATAMRKGMQEINANIAVEIDIANTKNYAAALAGLHQQVDAFLVTPLINDAGPILNAIRSAGFPQPIVGGNSFNTLDLIAASGGAVNGAYVGAAWNPGANNAMSRKFVDDYTKAYGSAPDLFAAQGFAAVEVLVAAAKNAGSVENAALRSALGRTKDLETIFGKMTMTGREAQYEPVIQQFQDGKLVVVQ